MDSRHESGRTLPERTIERVQALAATRLGMEDRPGKERLLSVRTGRHMRELGVRDPDQYLRLLEEDPTGERMRELMDLLTTNHTAFWREPNHFEWLREQLTATSGNQAQQTIWCAASSSGEEAYTLAMVVREAMGAAAAARMRVLATDVSTRMLKTGRAGIYSRQRIDPLPEAMRRQYFEQGKDQLGGQCRVTANLRSMVHFRWLNLVEPLPAIGPFPFIFCRNVMIYFSHETRMRIVRQLLQRLTPGGYLVVGHAEGLSGIEADMEYVRPAVYRRRQVAEKWD